MYKSLLVTDSVNVLARFGFAHIAGLARVKRFNSSGHRVHTVINCLLPLLACCMDLLLVCVFVYCDDFHYFCQTVSQSIFKDTAKRGTSNEEILDSTYSIRARYWIAL